MLLILLMAEVEAVREVYQVAQVAHMVGVVEGQEVRARGRSVGKASSSSRTRPRRQSR